MTRFRDWELKSAEKSWNEEMYLDNDNIPRWKSNNHVPMADMLAMWKYLNKPFDYETTLMIREKEDKESLEKYRKRFENRKISEEEKYEMRSTFGEGTKVVDILTGEAILL